MTRLDRNFGMFEGLGAAAYRDGVIEAFKMQHNQEIEEMEIDFNNLVDDYNSLLTQAKALQAKNRKLREKLRVEIDDFNQLTDEYNVLANEYNAVLNDRNQKYGENKTLKEEINALKNQLSNKTKECDDFRVKWINSNTNLTNQIEELEEKEEVHYSQLNQIEQEKEQTERVFAVLYNQKSKQETKHMLNLKVSNFQKKFLQQLVCEAINKGIYSKENILLTYERKVEEQDKTDVSRNGVTLSEALAWLRVSNPDIPLNLLP